MADGFKIADAFVEVEARLNDPAIVNAANKTGQRAGDELERQVVDAGDRAGSGFGNNFSRGADSRIRDMRGRFVKSSELLGEEGGKRSGDRFGSGFGGKILGSITDIGKKGGSLLGDGLSNLGPGGPAIGAAVIGAVAATAPVAGVILGGALLGGVTAAGIGIGLAATIRQAPVKAAAAGLKSTILGEIDTIGREWTPTMLGAISQIRGAVPSLGAELRSALSPAKEYVAPLVQGFLNLVRNVMPGFRDVLANARPIVDAIAAGLGNFGTDLSDTLSGLSEYSDEFASGIMLAFEIAGGLVKAGGQILEWLAQAYSKTLDWAIAFSDFMSNIPGVGDKFDEWNEKQRELKSVAEGTSPVVAGLSSNLEKTGASAEIAADASEELAQRQIILNGSFSAGVDAAGDLATMFDILNGKAQSAEEAELGYQEALDKATASLKENGKTTDANTAKGRANREALLALAQAGAERAQAQYEQTVATKGTTAAENAAQRSYSASRDALVRTARQMGMTKSEAKAYADRIMAIPKSWSTTVNANTTQASNRIDGISARLRAIPDETVNVIINERRGAKVARQLGDRAMSTGGAVIGQGPKGVDSEPRILAPGEHVLTDKEVDAMGGHARVEAFRRSLRAGMPATPTPVVATASTPAAGNVTNVHIGSVEIDASKLRSIEDLINFIERLIPASRAQWARRPTMAGSTR